MTRTKKVKHLALGKKDIIYLLKIVVCSLFMAFSIGLLNCIIRNVDISEHFNNNYYRYFVVAGFIAISLFAVMAYFRCREEDIMAVDTKKCLNVIVLSMIFTYAFCVFFGSSISLYSMPLMILPLLVASLIDWRPALISNTLVSIGLVFFYKVIDSSLSLYPLLVCIFSNLIGSLFIITKMNRLKTRMTLLGNVLVINFIINFVVSSLSQILLATINFYSILNILLWSLLGAGLNVSLFMILLPIFERVFRLYSNFRLEELCSPDNKIIKEFAELAPGTFSHSAEVALYAQFCAYKIGENPSLAKAAAYYHDIGKLKNPLCFTENQKGYNPHDDYIPEVSVYMITDHVKTGYQRIKEEKLPDILADIALQHHGTTPVKYFFYKVKKITDKQLEQEEYCYAGPKPQTKLAALIMITDTVEAATRSLGVEPEEAELRKFIHGLIQDKINTEQFSECPITYQDLKTIEETLIDIIPRYHHQRVKYDNNNEK